MRGGGTRKRNAAVAMAEASASERRRGEYFRSVTGYSMALASRLKPTRRHDWKPGRDQTLYSQQSLPGPQWEEHFTVCHMPDPCARDQGRPTAVRDVLIFTVPCDLLSPNASRFGGCNVQSTVACQHERALSFLMYALYVATVEDKCDMRVYVEAVVRDHRPLPVVGVGHSSESVATYRARPKGSLDTELRSTTARNNLTGYRVWVYLLADCWGPEVLFRRAMFRVQALVGASDLEGSTWKLKFTLITDEKTRSEAIAEEAARVLPSKKSRGDDADDDDDDDDDDGGGASKRKNKAREELARRIEATIKYPLSSGARRDVLDHAHSAGAQFVGVYCMESYIKQFITPQVLAAGMTMPTDTSALYSALSGGWGEAERLDTYQDPLGAVLSVRRLMSFEMSVLALTARQLPEAAPCAAQCLADNYGLVDGVPQFPLPSLVRRMPPGRLDPVELFEHQYFWSAQQFEEEMSALSGMRDLQQAARRQRINDASRLAQTIGMRITQSSIAARTRTGPPLNSVALRSRQAQLFGDAALATDTRAAAEELMRDLDALAGSPDPTQVNQADRDRSTSTEHVMGAVTTLGEYTQRRWGDALRLINELEAPACAPDADAWREMLRWFMNRLRVADATDALMSTLNESENVSEHHRGAYRLLTRTSDLSRVVRPIAAVAPHMTQSGNAVLGLLRTMLMLKLQGGYAELLDALYVSLVQSAMPGLENPDHTYYIGAAGSGKSEFQKRAMQVAIDGAAVAKGHCSTQSAYTNQFDSNTLDVIDELSNAQTNQTHHAIANNPMHNREKQELSTNTRQFERHVIDPDTGISRNHRVRVERVKVRLGNGNRMEVDGLNGVQTRDRALMDRVNVLPYVAPTRPRAYGRPIDVITDTYANEMERAWQAVCDRQKEDMSLTVMEVLLAKCGIVTQINTDVVDVMMRCAWDDIEKWWPSMVVRIRKAARSRQYGITWLFTCVTYMLFTSETSALLQWQRDPDTGRYMAVPMHFTLGDLPQIVAPYLYTRIDHGLWSVYRHLHISYPMLYYLILRIIAARECHFRRCWWAHAYRGQNIPLLQDTVTERWRERGTSPECWPDFYQYLLDLESALDTEIASRNQDQEPAFAVAPGGVVDPAAAAGQAATDEDSGAPGPSAYLNTAVGVQARRRGAAAAFLDKAQLHAALAERARIKDPNWLDTGLTKEQLSNKAAQYLRQYFLMDAEGVLSALELIAADIDMHVPVMLYIKEYQIKSGIKPHHIRFQRDRTATSTAEKVQHEVRHMTVPLLQARRTLGSSVPTVHINTAGLMLPPQEIAILALTAAEHRHTRVRDTVLVTELLRQPGSLTAWQTRPRPRDLVVDSVGDTGPLNQRQTATAARATGDSMMMAVAAQDQQRSGAREYLTDLEDDAYNRHMATLYQYPPLHEIVALLYDSGDTRAEYDSVAKEWLTARRVATDLRQSYAARNPGWTVDTEMRWPLSAEIERATAAWRTLHPAQPQYAETERERLSAMAPEVVQSAKSEAAKSANYPRAQNIDSEVARAFARIAPAAKPLYLQRRTERLEARIKQIDKELDELRKKHAATDANAMSVDQTDATAAKMAALSGTKDAVVQKLKQESALPPPESNSDATDTDTEKLEVLDKACDALMTLLCSEPWYSKYSVPLSATNEWRGLFAAVFRAKLAGAAGPLVLGHAQCLELKRNRNLVPALDDERFTRPPLHWLERMLWMSDMLSSMVLVYTYEAGGAAIAKFHHTLHQLGRVDESGIERLGQRLRLSRTNYLDACSAPDTNVVKSQIRQAEERVLLRHRHAVAMATRIRVAYYNDTLEQWRNAGAIEQNWHTSAQQLAILSEVEQDALDQERLRIRLYDKTEASTRKQRELTHVQQPQPQQQQQPQQSAGSLSAAATSTTADPKDGRSVTTPTADPKNDDASGHSVTTPTADPKDDDSSGCSATTSKADPKDVAKERNQRRSEGWAYLRNIVRQGQVCVAADTTRTTSISASAQ